MSPPTSTLFKHQPLPIFSSFYFHSFYLSFIFRLACPTMDRQGEKPEESQGQESRMPHLAQGQEQRNPGQTPPPPGSTSLVLAPPALPLAPTMLPLGPHPGSSVRGRAARGRPRGSRAAQAGRGGRRAATAATGSQPGPGRGRPTRGRVARGSTRGRPARPPVPLFAPTQGVEAPVPVPVPVQVPAPTPAPAPTPSPDLLPVRLFVLARAHRYAADPAAAPQTLEQAVSEFVSFFPVDIAIADILTDEVLEVLNQLVRRREVSSRGPGGAGDSTPTLPLIRDTLVEQFREDRFAHRRELERRARPDTYTPYRQCMCRVLPLPCWRCGYGSSHHEGV